MQKILESVLDKEVEVFSTSTLSGGDINAVFKINSSAGVFCVKQNDRDQFPKMLQKEARGLREIGEKYVFIVPKVIGTFEDDTSQYLVLEFIESGVKSASFWENFGIQLAQMHRQSSGLFGWQEDNYIGSLHQSNTTHDSWSSFYTTERIMPQVKMAFDANKVDLGFIRMAERLCSKFDSLFPNETSSLLHGDLWSGNFMVSSSGDPVLIDPAVYYGHREMDLGMMQLFGGFSEELFDHYHQTYPLAADWKERIPLTQLYPLLVHVNLFGGGYIQSAASVIQRYS
ncbi:MAG: fructosamine kinase family protein [Fluviicola sp.]